MACFSPKYSGIRCIGITGGMGSGKSAVLGSLARIGYPTADADRFNAELLSSPECAEGLARIFGTSVLTPGGTIDRTVLRRFVFSDPEAKTKLELFLHPMIQNKFELWRDAFIDARLPCVFWIFYEASLLIEKGRTEEFDRLLLVTAPLALRRGRIAARGLEDQVFENVLAAQLSDEEKSKSADYIIVNGGSSVDLQASVYAALSWLGDQFAESRT
jgi:dephospho-CoA kinase